MARTKKESVILAKAEQRLNGLKSIDATLDLGSGVTVAALQQSVTTLKQTLEDYNQMLSQLDEKLNLVSGQEKALRDLVERCLSGVAARYGKDSSEYEKAGGVRKSERKRPVRKAAKDT
jgi:CII-binding regulator of phage lambda lysogenization HflD